MATTTRVFLVAGALLASASLAQAEDKASFSTGVREEHADFHPIEKPAPEVAPAPVQVAETKAAAPAKTSRHSTRLARRTAKTVAVAALKATFPAALAAAEPSAAKPATTASSAVATASDASTKPTEPAAKQTEAAAPPPPAAPTPGGPREMASGTVSELLEKHARLNGVPLKLAEAVVTIESRGNAHASHAGALGLMQIKYGTARAAGFSGPAVGLFAADTNLHYGMKILGDAYRAAGGDTCGALMRYQSGHYATHMNNANRAYCSRARALMAGV